MSSEKKKIKEMEVMVADVIEETYDTTTLVFFTGNDTLNYEPGHFLTISPHQFEGLERWTAYLEDLKGKKEPSRAYSMCSSPEEKYLAVTVKEEQYIPGKTPYPPLLSPILAKRTPPGAKMVVTGFTGPYTLSPEVRAVSSEIVHICAGSGIVPSFSIIKHDLRVNETLRHTLIYSNKKFEDIIFYRQFAQLQQEFPDRLKVIHSLTRETDVSRYDGDFHAGRVSMELLAGAIKDAENTTVFACGPDHAAWQRKAAKETGEELPPSFLGTVLACLNELGVAKNRIIKESYG